METVRPVRLECRDAYYWDYSKSGHYTVKSAYWVATNLLKEETDFEVVQPSLDSYFQLVWKVDICPKIKHSIWRCSSDCLSVGATMRYMHLARDGVCSRCQDKDETLNHIFFTCPYARLVWALSPILAQPSGD